MKIREFLPFGIHQVDLLLHTHHKTIFSVVDGSSHSHIKMLSDRLLIKFIQIQYFLRKIRADHHVCCLDHHFELKNSPVSPVQTSPRLVVYHATLQPDPPEPVTGPPNCDRSSRCCFRATEVSQASNLAGFCVYR